MSDTKPNSCMQSAIGANTVVSAIVACIAAVMEVPEFRKWVGLDESAPAAPAVEPTSRPVTNDSLASEAAFATSTVRPTEASTKPFNFPTASAPTPVPDEDLIFADNFDGGINTYWQTVGDWMSVNGQPVLAQGTQTTNYASPFVWGRGGLILTGVSEFDNYAVEFDLYYDGFASMLFSYEDENNYKAWKIVNNGDDFFIDPGCQLVFVTQGNTTIIPQSNVPLYFNFVGPNRARVEIRGRSLALYLNGTQVYNFIGLPDVMTGPIGFVGTAGRPALDNVSLYQLSQ